MILGEAAVSYERGTPLARGGSSGSIGRGADVKFMNTDFFALSEMREQRRQRSRYRCTLRQQPESLPCYQYGRSCIDVVNFTPAEAISE